MQREFIIKKEPTYRRQLIKLLFGDDTSFFEDVGKMLRILHSTISGLSLNYSIEASKTQTTTELGRFHEYLMRFKTQHSYQISFSLYRNGWTIRLKKYSFPASFDYISVEEKKGIFGDLNKDGGYTNNIDYVPVVIKNIIESIKEYEGSV